MNSTVNASVTGVSDAEVRRVIREARRARSDCMATALRGLVRWIHAPRPKRAPVVAGPLRTC